MFHIPMGHMAGITLIYLGAGLNVWGVKGLQKHLEVDEPCVPLEKDQSGVFTASGASWQQRYAFY